MKSPLIASFVFAFGLVFALTVGGTAEASGQAIQLAQQNQNVCFSNCISQYGTDNKRSCALQCGLANSSGGFTGQAGGKPAGKDCGTIYKQCRKACDKDKACKSKCREARSQCF